MTSPRVLAEDTSSGPSSKELAREHAKSDDDDDEDRSQPRMVRIANSSLLLLEDYSSSTASLLRGGFFPEEHLLDRVVCSHNIGWSAVIAASFSASPRIADIFFCRSSASLTPIHLLELLPLPPIKHSGKRCAFLASSRHRC